MNCLWRENKMGSWDFRYPHIAHVDSVKPTPRIFLGKTLLWTTKKDGECIAIWINDEGNIQISSRNNIQAQSDIVHRVTTSEDYPKVIELLQEFPQMVCYVEECKEGRSVTRIETYDRTTLFLFDMYDRNADKWLNYTNVHQYAFHFNIPVVKLWAKTSHRSMKSLLAMADEALAYCKENSLEGMVIKPQCVYIDNGFNKEYTQTKIKQDIPPRPKIKIDKGEPILPSIPENEIFGAINHVHQQLGDEGIRDVSIAMPLVAQSISEECKKHFYSKPKENMFHYYKDYLGSV